MLHTHRATQMHMHINTRRRSKHPAGQWQQHTQLPSSNTHTPSEQQEQPIHHPLHTHPPASVETAPLPPTHTHPLVVLPVSTHTHTHTHLHQRLCCHPLDQGPCSAPCACCWLTGASRGPPAAAAGVGLQVKVAVHATAASRPGRQPAAALALQGRGGQ
jgi:hypothetical protein